MSSKLTNHANPIKSNRTKSLDKSKNFIDNHNIKFPLSKHTQKPANFIVSTSTATQKPTFKPTKNQIQLYKIQLEASHQQYPSTKQSQSKNKSRPNTRHLPRKSPVIVRNNSNTMNKYKPSMHNSHNLRSINSANKNNVKGILQKNLGIQNHKQSKSTTQIKMNKTFNNQSIGKKMDFSHSPEIRKKELNNKLSPNLGKKKPISKSPNPPNAPSICSKQFGMPLYRKDLGSRGSKKNITQNKFKKMVPNNNVLKKNVTNVSNSNKNIFSKKQQKFVTSEEFTHVDLNKKNVSNNNHNHNDKKGNVDNLHKHEPQIEKTNITSVVGGVSNQKVTDNIKIISTQNLKEPSQDNSIIHNNSNKITQNDNDIQIENNNNKNEFKTPQEKIISETPPIKEEPIKHSCRKIKDIYEFTHVGFDGEQDKEDNQDSYFIFNNFTGNPNYKYFSVCDGHGVEGHFVSSFIKAVLPLDLSNYLANIDVHTYLNLHEDIIEIFKQTNTKLVEEENINSIFSGSTCVSVIYTPEKLICPNVGDSRAVLGKFVNNKWIAQNLTRDHKPSEEDEAARVRQSNGRIQPLIDEGEEIGPLRVWVQEDDVPGLAMTRSFGDRVGKEVGVSCEPEIKEFPLSEEDKFMIIASDGVWEFIDSQECVDMIKDFYLKNDMENCCEYIYEESKKRWLKEEEVIDDTTMIIVVFE